MFCLKRHQGPCSAWRLTSCSEYAGALHPALPQPVLRKMVNMLDQMHRHANVERTFAAAGGPWEFNLRDLLRWCQLAESAAATPSEVEAAQGGASACAEGAVPMACGDGGKESGHKAAADGDASSHSAALSALELSVEHFMSMLFIQRLRTESDRDFVRRCFQRVWGRELVEVQRPALLLTPHQLRIGCANVHRKEGISCQLGGPGTSGQRPEDLQLLTWQLPLLESAAQAAAQGWMSLLVGGPAVGKTSVARLLAQLCGQSLLEVPLTSGTDTSDLLGSFEQLEPARRLQEVSC